MATATGSSQLARLAELVRRGAIGGRAHRRRHLGALRDPRLPQPRHRAVGEGRSDGGRPHRRLRARPGGLLGLLRRALRHARGQAPQRRPPRARADGARRPARRRDHPERRHAAPHARAPASWSRCTARSPPARARSAAERAALEGVRARLGRAPTACPAAKRCGAPMRPDVVLFGELLPHAALQRAHELCLGAEVLLCVGSSLEVHPVASLPLLTHRAGGAIAIITAGPHAAGRDRRRAPARRRRAGAAGARRRARAGVPAASPELARPRPRPGRRCTGLRQPPQGQPAAQPAPGR